MEIINQQFVWKKENNLYYMDLSYLGRCEIEVIDGKFFPCYCNCFPSKNDKRIFYITLEESKKQTLFWAYKIINEKLIEMSRLVLDEMI